VRGEIHVPDKSTSHTSERRSQEIGAICSSIVHFVHHIRTIRTNNSPNITVVAKRVEYCDLNTVLESVKSSLAILNDFSPILNNQNHLITL